MAYHGIPPGWHFSDVWGWQAQEQPRHFRHGYTRSLLPQSEAMDTEEVTPETIPEAPVTPQPEETPAPVDSTPPTVEESDQLEELSEDKPEGLFFPIELCRKLCDVHVMGTSERRDLAKGIREAMASYDELCAAEAAEDAVDDTEGGLTENVE